MYTGIFSDGADYTGIRVLLLTFSFAISNVSFTVAITDDNLHESDEVFHAGLSFFGERTSGVDLASSFAQVTILDDDS